MASRAAEAVAKEVIKKVGNGEKINMQEIQTKHGYSKKSAKSMKVKETKTFQEAMSPVVEALITEREAVIKDMKKKRGKAKYRDLTDALDKLTKNIQLLNGGKTENNHLTISWE